MTPSQKAEAEAIRANLARALDAGGQAQTEARAVVLAKMILRAGGAALTDQIAEARAEGYHDSVGDKPAWAVAEAVRRWNRGACGDQNYSFVPSPAVLLEVVEGILAPYRARLLRVETVLRAVTIEQALDPKPLDKPVIRGPGGRTVVIPVRHA